MASSGRKKPPSSSRNASVSAIRQQTIAHLFSGSQQKQSLPTPPELSPSSKRKRSFTSAQDVPPSRPATSCNMYNFSQKASSGGVISPDSPRSKQRRISVGAKVDNAPAQGGIKKLAVRNFKQARPESDHNAYVQTNIALLDSALASIFSNQPPSKSSEELYRACENVCKMGYAEQLATMVMTSCKAHVVNDLKPPLANVASTGTDVEVLRAVLAAWQLWLNQMKEVRCIFFYLDRSHLLQIKSPSIHDTSISLFRTYVYGECGSRAKVIDGACELLLTERQGHATPDNAALFASAIKMFHVLQVYTTDFEPRMLTLSQTFVAEWSDKECAAKPLPDYVDACVHLIATEMMRCEEMQLDSTTRRSLLALLEDHLVERKYDVLTNQESVAKALDAQSGVDDIKKLFDLLQRKRAGVRLKEAFSRWLEESGTAIIFDDKEQDRMVERLLEFKQRLDHIWRFSFSKHEELGHALRGSFEKFMNKSKKTSATWNTDNSRTGEMIAKFVDELLRKGAKGIPAQIRTGGVKPARAFTRADEVMAAGESDETDNEREVENQLDQVLDLFRFVHGKAVFEAFYKKDLARRLLLGRSASNDAEKNMLERLKTECGAGFTHNLEQMFKDIELADDEAKAYKSRFENSDRSGIVDLSVSVLSSAAWPSYPEVEAAIPPEVKKSLDDYTQFYHSKHSGRKLAWKHALAHCQMKADFPRGKKELVVSAFQAIILLLFNGRRDDEQLSYEHIKAESGLSAAEVERTLQSLACAKLRPLTKHPRGRDINPTDTFSVNAGFQHDKYRVKINSIQHKETREENRETHVRVAADRQFETQAAIVRILKERKRIGHAQLIAQVIEKTRSRGVLQPAEIKREIDKLIEKEYLERAEGNVYEYLA